uniref:Uncharacterized protein n=1 Tax=Arundo donax TaxID=35708 RepID=A0A0A9GE75_ARUDO
MTIQFSIILSTQKNVLESEISFLHPNMCFKNMFELFLLPILFFNVGCWSDLFLVPISFMNIVHTYLCAHSHVGFSLALSDLQLSG